MEKHCITHFLIIVHSHLHTQQGSSPHKRSWICFGMYTDTSPLIQHTQCTSLLVSPKELPYIITSRPLDDTIMHHMLLILHVLILYALPIINNNYVQLCTISSTTRSQVITGMLKRGTRSQFITGMLTKMVQEGMPHLIPLMLISTV